MGHPFFRAFRAVQVISLTAKAVPPVHADIDNRGGSMAISLWQMNRFERILFRIALALGILLISIRLGAIVVVWFLHHPH